MPKAKKNAEVLPDGTVRYTERKITPTREERAELPLSPASKTFTDEIMSNEAGAGLNNKKKIIERPATLKLFIETAYTKKGKIPSLFKSNEIKSICANGPLTEEDTYQLLELAHNDSVFCVPAQLILLLGRLKSSPIVHKSLQSFISTVLRHNVLIQADHSAVIFDQDPDEQHLVSVLKDLATTNQSSDNPALPEKTRSPTYKKNTLDAVIAWIHVLHEISLWKLSEAVVAGVKSPKDKSRQDELDNLLPVVQSKGMALAIEHYQEKIKKLEFTLNQTISSEVRKDAALKQKDLELQNKSDELTELEARFQDAMNKYNHEIELAKTRSTHLKDDSIKLRNSLLRSLKDAETLIYDGLIALRRSPPKVNIVEDHLERLAAAFRELKLKLEES